MTPEQLDCFHALLENERQNLLEHLRDGESATRTVILDQASVGRLSRMDALQDQAMAIAAQRRKQARLQHIHAALARIRSGTYGVCRDCEEEILRGRLENDPTATVCIGCATLREQR